MSKKVNLKKSLKGGVEKMEKVKCEKCKYVWKTNSEKMFVTCPNCLRKTSVNPLENGKA